jgi:choline dehydrogenase
MLLKASLAPCSSRAQRRQTITLVGVTTPILQTCDLLARDLDVFVFGGPVNFRGYFPNYSVNATIEHNYWTWSLLKSHPRSRAGSVTLRSADPLDTPNILFNFFEDGADDDFEALYESVLLARNAFSNQSVPFTEVLPGSDVQT